MIRIGVHYGPVDEGSSVTEPVAAFAERLAGLARPGKRWPVVRPSCCLAVPPGISRAQSRLPARVQRRWNGRSIFWDAGLA